MSKIMITKT